MQEITFDEWLTELQGLFARIEYPEYISQTGNDCWKEYYDNGDSPDDAFFTEISYWDDDK